MAMSTQIGAYKDCEEYFEQALASKNGVAVNLDSPGQARRMAQRLNMYRALVRKNSENIYPAASPQRGTSPYDNYRIVVEKNASRVLIRLGQPATVEEL